MKKLVQILVLSGVVMVPSISMAEDSPLTGNLAFVSDYQFRGVSQTNEEMAIQGGFDYAHPSGFYLGTWGSNVSFANANMELDIYGGYKAKAGDVEYNVGLLQYYYPGETGAPSVNTLEAYAGMTFKGAGLKVSYSTGDYFGMTDSDGTVYVDGSYEYEFMPGTKVAAHYGYTFGQGTQFDYADWKVGVTKDVSGYVFGLAYTDTDEHASLGAAGESRVILSVAKTF